VTRAEPDTQAVSDSSPLVRPAVLVAGAIFLALAAGAALMLVIEHVSGLSIPGCGPGSPCQRATESFWGRVPIIGWPNSHLGLAYFLGLLVAWFTWRRGVPSAARWTIRLGVLLSLGFTAVMILGEYMCPYCLATHLGNIAFWLLTEFATRRGRGTVRNLAFLPVMFIVATLALVGVETRWRVVARETAEAQARASGEAILAAASQPTSVPVTAPPTTSAPATQLTSTPTESQPGRGFIGRYRLGPLPAAIRIVIFMDYQCKGCHLLELELRALLEKHPEVSFSVKHWPADADCNPHAGDRSHVRACLAARAAEAAGLLRGSDGFWQMHNWLFDQNGRFTTDELHAALTKFGYDIAEFERLMTGDETRILVQADIDEGFALGLRSTPLVFVNGHEFKGWSAPLALTKVIDQVSQANLPPKYPTDDHPLPAREAYIADWQSMSVRELPTTGRWPRGPTDARVQIVVWGDYQQPNTALADSIIRGYLNDRADAQYTFHAYPLDPACNSAAKSADYPQACLAAKAAAAAAHLGDVAGYWKLHDWLMQNQAIFSADTLRAALPPLGFDVDAFFAEMESPAVAAAITADVEAAQTLGLQNSPLMYINGKVVPRWIHGDQPMLRPILEAAGQTGK